MGVISEGLQNLTSRAGHGKPQWFGACRPTNSSPCREITVCAAPFGQRSRLSGTAGKENGYQVVPSSRRFGVGAARVARIDGPAFRFLTSQLKIRECRGGFYLRRDDDIDCALAADGSPKQKDQPGGYQHHRCGQLQGVTAGWIRWDAKPLRTQPGLDHPGGIMSV
jgi:hypothetical protein